MVQTAFSLIKNENKYLLIQEGGSRNKGLWNMPGGHVDKGETPEQGAIREAKEEAGVDVELIKKLVSKAISGAEYLGRKEEVSDTIEVNIFSARYITGQIRHGEEELGIGWFTPDEIKTLPLRFKFLADLL